MATERRTRRRSAAPPDDGDALGRSYAPPVPRGDLVLRRRLVTRLLADRDPAVVALVAPAGFGKSTVLAQWAGEDARPVAWVALRPEHDDPVVLIEELVAAIAEVTPLEPGLSSMVGSLNPPVSTRMLPRLARSLRATTLPFLLVADDAHVLVSDRALEVVSVVAASLPPASQLAIGARAEPAIHGAMLRAQGRLSTVGQDELALDEAEAAEVLRAEGAPADPDAVREVVRVTEGWPVGIRLAARALREGATAEPEGRFTGDHHLVLDYVREELLGAQPRGVVDFLLGSAVLDELSAELCDALLERTDSGTLLDRLAREQMFLTPIDPRHSRFRYHQLFSDALRAELARRDPARAHDLDMRASALLAERGDGDGAVRHALAAGERGTAAGLVWRFLPGYLSGGRAGTLRRWLGRFDVAEQERDAHLALSRAWLYVETRSDLVARWARVAEFCDRREPLADGSTLDGAVALLRATVGAEGVEQVGRQAAFAYERTPEGSAWRSLCRFFQGASAHLRDGPEAAAALLEEGAARAGTQIGTVAVLCVSWLGVMAALAEDWPEATRRADEARAVIRDGGLDEYGSAAIGVALAALVCAHADRREEARRHEAHARRLTAVIEGVGPFFAATIRAVLARVGLRLGDPAAATVMLEEGELRLAGAWDAPVLQREYADLRAAVAALPRSALTGPGALTSAEVRILRFLPTHLSFREIGERLHVSRFTVKSQAMAVYRKLGVSSRSEAVERAVAIGLIDP